MDEIFLTQEASGNILVPISNYTSLQRLIKLPTKEVNGEKVGVIYPKAKMAMVSKISNILGVVVQLELAS